MKKFHFSLQKLMDFREQELDRQKNTLSALQAELRQLHESARELREKVAQASAELEQVCARGAQISDISLRKRYIISLQQEIHRMELLSQQKQQEVNAQLDVVVEATKDVKTLEKLEEKQREEYAHMEGKENELFIEEFVSGQTVRAGQHTGV